MNRNSPIEPVCREAFIPYPRRDILQLCLEDGGLAEHEIAQFQAFCEILAALFHFQFHRVLEEVKESYRVFDPNTDVFLLYEPKPHRIQQMSQKVGTAFESILQRANYVPLTTAALHEALDSPALLNLKTDIDFNDFEQVLCYYRGKSEITITQKRLLFWRKQQTVQLFERLVLLIQFKDEAYFQAQSDQRKRPIAPRQFIPGKTYLFFYKNLPRPDLRLLFPNVRTRIPTKDRLLFALPAAIMAS